MEILLIVVHLVSNVFWHYLALNYSIPIISFSLEVDRTRN